MSGDRFITSSEHGSRSDQALLDLRSVTNCELLNGLIDNVGLGRINQRGKVADSLLGVFVDLDRRLAHV